MSSKNSRITCRRLCEDFEKVRRRFFFLDVEGKLLSGPDNNMKNFNRWGDTSFSSFLGHVKNDRMCVGLEAIHRLLLIRRDAWERQFALELVTLDPETYPPDLRHDLPRNDKEVKQ